MRPDRVRDGIRVRPETVIRMSPPIRRKPTPRGPGDRCPVCGSQRVAWIVFGVVDWTPQLEEALIAGEVVLGGCMVFGDDPDRSCNACRYRWRTRSSREQRQRPLRSGGDGDPGDGSAPKAKKSVAS